MTLQTGPPYYDLLSLCTFFSLATFFPFFFDASPLAASSLAAFQAILWRSSLFRSLVLLLFAVKKRQPDHLATSNFAFAYLAPEDHPSRTISWLYTS